MMVSHENRCLFINIPKCATVSIRIAFELKLVTPPIWHSYWEQTREIAGEEVLENYFKFSIVRNPWERVISAWKMFEQHEKRKQDRSYTLAEFLQVVTDHKIGYEAHYRNPREREQWEHSKDNIRHHTLPALHPYYGLADRSGHIKADFVGRFENLQADLVYISGELGLKQLRIPKVNKTRHLSYQVYYDSDSVDLVRDYYRQDIEAFDYQFD